MPKYKNNKYQNNRISHVYQQRSSKRFGKFNLRKSFLILCLILIAIVLSIIPLRLAITRLQVPKPQAIFVLDGQKDRIRFATEFWHLHPDLDIWISGCTSNLAPNRSIIKQMNVPLHNVYFDIRAIDTVTNFSTMVEEFSRQKIWHVYLITSDYHMDRAMAIATLIFGSSGIAVTPISVSSNVPSEPIKDIGRDALRSLLWIFSGSTGEKLVPVLWQQKLISCSANWPLPLGD